MASPAVSCNLVNRNFSTLVRGIDFWANKESTRALFNDPHEAALRLLNSNFFMDIKQLRYIKDLTPGQVRSYLSRLNELNSAVKSCDIASKWGKLFWQGSHFGKKDPVFGSLLNNLQKTQFWNRSQEISNKTMYKSILDAAKEEALARDFEKSGMRAAEKERARLEQMKVEAMAEWKNADEAKDAMGRDRAEQKIRDVDGQLDDHIQKTHLQVYDEMIKIIEVGIPKAIVDKYNKLESKAFVIKKGKRIKVKDEKIAARIEKLDKGERVLKLDKGELTNLVVRPDGSALWKSENLSEAIINYQNLMENMYKTLRDGVNKRIDSVLKRMEYLGEDQSDALEAVRERMREKYMPRYRQGYFPHYVKDLNAPFMDGMMKHFDDLQRNVNSREKSKDKSVEEIIKDMNFWISKHTEPEAKDLETGKFGYNYDRDFVNSVRNYVEDVNRFNYISYMDGHMLDALSSVEKIYRTEGDAKGYAGNLVDVITDMHMATNGDTSVSPNTRAWMRSVLGMEFVSKLGINPRSAARNWFQRLLDYVTWGPVQVGKLKQYLKSDMLSKEKTDFEGYIDSILRDNGLLYDEVAPEFVETQLQSPSSMFKIIEWNNDTQKFEAVKKSRAEKISEGVSWLASKSSWLHRKAENSNRKHTFKLGYAQMHSWLNNSRYRNSLEGKSEGEKDNIIKKAAERYAIQMTVMNHFDYADYAKSKALRSKVGRFAGQFQHYMFEFFERNQKILRESKYDILEGNLVGKDASGLAQAYRMGFFYFLAPALASIYTGVDFGNLVEHDTYQRLKQWSTFMLGDDDEIAEAFYGKGPLISTFGGPITSDIIDIGVMMDLIDLDEDSLLTLVAGLENYDPYKGSSDVSKKLRILNTFLGRAYERHIPQLRKGRIGWSVQQELGLYPTAEARKAKKRADNLRKKIVPSEIEQALKALGQ